MKRSKAEGKESSVLNSDPLSGVRIARVSTVPFFVATQLKHQIELLSGSGALVTVVTSKGPELASLETLSGVACLTIDIPRPISPWRDLLALIRLFLFFRRREIDIAHSTTPKAGLLTAVAGFFAGVPIRLHTFTGQPWKSMRGAKRILARASDRAIGKLNTRCYADSESQRQFLVSQEVIDANHLSVIGAGSLAGVDMERFNPERFSTQDRDKVRRSLSIPASATVLLFVGRITVDKGVHELLGAFRQLKMAGNGAHLVFVGHFDSDSGVEGGVARHDIECIPDTHIVGYSERPEEYMSIADILCLPSYREGFGTVVIEAAAMGVPTVGTDIYGLSDAVVNGETGILVPPHNAALLEQALSALLDDEKRRTQMGYAARQRAKEMFDADNVNAKLIEEYLQLLIDKRVR